MSYIYGVHILDVSRSHNDAAQSVGLLCGRSLTEIVGSTPTGSMDICLL
jgi:hypothetical protein